MAKRRKVANLLAVAILAYLNERPKHPYELGQALRERGDARSIKYTHGTLYMVVRQLDAAGYIRAVATTRDRNRPERTVYDITAAGRTELNDWLAELLAKPEHEYPRFVAGLSLMAGLRPEVVVKLLLSRVGLLREQHRAIVTSIEQSQAGGLPPIFLVEEDYRRVLLEAEISFVDRLIKDITDPDTGWATEWAKALDAAEAQANQAERAVVQATGTTPGTRGQRP